MNGTIQGLVEIEKKAKEIISSVEKDYNNLPGLIAKKAEDIKSAVQADTDRKISAEKMKAEKAYQQAVSAIQASEADSLSAMEKEFDTMHQVWEKEIFETITGAIAKNNNVETVQ